MTQQTLEMPLGFLRTERLRDWAEGKVGLPSAVASFPIKD